MTVEDKAAGSAVLQQAAEWYWQLREPDVPPDIISAWQAWLCVSAENREAFSSVEAVLQQVDCVEDPPWPTEEELVADDYDGSAPITDWRAQGRRAAHRSSSFERLSGWLRPPQRIWAVATSVVMMLVVTMLAVQFSFEVGSGIESRPNFAIYETRAAEHRDVHLPDGSSVSLGGKSMISVAYTADSRLVLLKQGAAFFDVAKETERPFLVQAGSRQIAAVGTAFNVTRQDDRVVVTVTEGTVIVTPETTASNLPPHANNTSGSSDTNTARLEAGQQMTYDAQALTPVIVADPADAVAWRAGRLKYRGEALRYVIEDVNRYADRPIILADDAAGNILFTGTVFQESVATWLTGLEQAFPVVIEETPDGIVIRHALAETR